MSDVRKDPFVVRKNGYVRVHLINLETVLFCPYISGNGTEEKDGYP
jgi:hypothetical protein